MPGNGEDVIVGNTPSRELGSCSAVGIAEKSPVRMAAVKVVASAVVVVRALKPSKFDMKNRRLVPLNSLGTRTGPPSVYPY